ncbi:MAG: cupredoxin domain-containing protein [Actinobacteria bacterium]|nr:cupredoxin domain-containing protein [Actinomycetota bacterium]
MSRRKITSLLLALVALTALAACGGENGGDGGDPTKTGAATGGDKGGGKGVTVELADFKITAPKTAKVGDKVTVTNTGKAPHNWVAKQGNAFKTKDLKTGEKQVVTLKKAGKVAYVCTIHPDRMSGSITIKK